MPRWRSVIGCPLAERGDAEAQYNLGAMYFHGQGVPQDYAEMVKWYRLAAEQGHAEALLMLAAMYSTGQGVAQDYAESARWYRLAAEQGYAEAQVMLGTSYMLALGVPQNYVQSHMWYNLAAARLPPGEDRDMAVRQRDGIAKAMTPAQIAEAQRLAREWKPK